MEIGPAAGADIDPPGLSTPASPHADLGFLDLLEDDAGLFEHQLSGIGQLDAPGLAAE